MSRWSRIANAFRPGRVSAEIDEELASHLEEAAGRGPRPRAVRTDPVIALRAN